MITPQPCVTPSLLRSKTMTSFAGFQSFIKIEK